MISFYKNIYTYFFFVFIFIVLFGHMDIITVNGQGNQNIRDEDQKFPDVPLDNPLTGVPNKYRPFTTSELFARIITGLLSVVGTLSFVVFIIGGTTWLTSSGNPEKVDAGKKMFIYAIVGLVVVFSSYAVLNLVMNALIP